jgi:hypothetical protein
LQIVHFLRQRGGIVAILTVKPHLMACVDEGARQNTSGRQVECNAAAATHRNKPSGMHTGALFCGEQLIDHVPTIFSQHRLGNAPVTIECTDWTESREQILPSDVGRIAGEKPIDQMLSQPEVIDIVRQHDTPARARG